MTAESDQPNSPPAAREVCAVSPARLAWGTYDHQQEKEIGEGDVARSYSADLIAMTGKVRKPFRFEGHLMVTTSITGSALTESGSQEFEAYRLTPIKLFTGTPTTYSAKTSQADDAEAARNDPKGFYDGMTVKSGGDSFVLTGPPVRFVAEQSPERPDSVLEPQFEQLSLFS